VKPKLIKNFNVDAHPFEKFGVLKYFGSLIKEKIKIVYKSR
jgi:hypothetical protein